MDSGLAGLIAAETVLSHSDGAHGILWVRGHTLAELVADFGYEGAVGLLWEEFAGASLPRAAMRAGTFVGPPGAVRTAGRIPFRPRRVVRAAGASTLASAADLRPGANS